SFGLADHGYRLGLQDQIRRYVLQSLLSGEGLDHAPYARRFDSRVFDDLPELADLEELGLVARTEDRLFLTEAALERSDAMGPWLYSDQVERLMEDSSWR